MSNELLERAATNYDTMRHISQVRNLLNRVVAELLSRGEGHDQSKLESPEVELLTEARLRDEPCEFGSPRHKEVLANLQPYLGPFFDHHYAHNRHHPQHFADGVAGMNLIDLVEFFADMASACQRSPNGNIRKSIAHNAPRFNMNPQLVRIFENTADWLEGQP